VLAELDYLLLSRRGVQQQLAVLAEIAGGAWKRPACATPDLKRAAEIIAHYSDQKIGLADASLVVLADRYRTERLLTLDARHFSVVRTIAGKPFQLLPRRH
jgi:uncharacterized protein